jgi:hypothetical protein
VAASIKKGLIVDRRKKGATPFEEDIRSSPRLRPDKPAFYKEREIEREGGKLSKRGVDRAYKAQLVIQ